MSRWVTATSVVLLIAWLAGGIAFAQRPTRGDADSAAFVREGRAALRRGDLDEAARALDQALVLDPRRVDAYVLRSAVYAARKQYQQGIALMRRAQLLAPNDAEVLTALGTHLVLSGDTATGVPLLEQVVAKEPGRYDAQLLLGRHWHAIGRWPDAIRALESYFAHRPRELAGEDARYQVELADSYLRFREPRKALALFETAARNRKHDLRARMGIAWATAALDCKKARSQLRELEPVAAKYPEIWLVEGQCALVLGDVTSALALGRRYLERAPTSRAAGHALVGEAYAARGAFEEAQRELETARGLEPSHRRWPVRLAYVQRRAGKLDDALATLDAVGTPASAALDPGWWVELGEVLLARGDAKGVIARLGPVLAELPNHAAVRTVLGEAQLAAGQAEAAIASLEEAEAIQTSARSRRLLARALATAGAAKLAANNASDAEPLLVRAEQLEPSALVLRDLGIAKLALGKTAEAVSLLERAASIEPTPIGLMLAARARAQAGDAALARALYERALASDPDNVEVALDWAASEVAGGDPAIAVAVLEKTSAAARSGAVAARHGAALAIARHAAGLVQLRAGNGAKAVELLRAAMASEATLARKCDLAVATVVAGDAAAARTALEQIQGQRCPFPPPADTQASAILIAFTDGLEPRRAARALDRLTALASKASGITAQMLGTATRIVAINAAQDAYRKGRFARARQYLAIAKTANAAAGSDEIAHDIAVIDVAEGRYDAAITALERLAGKLPEALVNLGLAYERKGDHARALDAWRRARKANVRFPQLTDWLDAKERIYGEGAR